MRSMVEIKKLPPGYALGYVPIGMTPMGESDIEALYQDTKHILETQQVMGASNSTRRNVLEAALSRKALVMGRNLS